MFCGINNGALILFEDVLGILKNPPLRNYIACLVLAGSVWAATSPYYSLLTIEQLHLSPQKVASLGFGSGIVTLIVGILITVYSDVVPNPTKLILLTLFAGAVGYLAIGIFPLEIVLVSMYLLIIPVSNANSDLLFACIRSASNPLGAPKASFISSIARSLYALIWIVVPAVVGIIVSRSNVSTAWTVAGIASALCIPLFLLGARTTPPKRDQERSGKNPLLALKEITSPEIMAKIIAVSLISASQRLSQLVIPLIVIAMPGGSPADIGFFFGVTALMEVPCMLAWGMFSRRYSVRTALVVGALIFAVFLVLIANTSQLGMLFLIAILNAAGLSSILSMPISYFHETVPADRPGVGSAFNIMTDFSANAFTALIFGIGLSVISYAQTAYLAAVCAIIGLLGIVFIPHSDGAKQ